MNRMKRIYLLVVQALFLLSSAIASAQPSTSEHVYAFTDKDCYLAGERLHVSIAITDSHQQLSPWSKVAYVELTDVEHLCAQGIVAIDGGRGWADIPLPETLHSGYYQLSVYTRNMPAASPSALCQKVIAVVNTLHITRQDELAIFAPDSLDENGLTPLPAQGEEVQNLEEANDFPSAFRKVVPSKEDLGQSVLLFSTLTLERCDLEVIHPTTVSTAVSTASDDKEAAALPVIEHEGHIVKAQIEGEAAVKTARLVMVGKQAAIYDGQQQSDGTWLFYTNELYGKLPSMLCCYDSLGQSIPMQFVSPYARLLSPRQPRLEVRCSREDLLARSLSAQREQALTNMLAIDTLQHSRDLFSTEPLLFYDLDEWTRLTSVREILVEFVQNVKRRKVEGVAQLYAYDPIAERYSQWPSLVLLDGVPVHDIDTFLDYDARLLKYVQIYSDRYTFGDTFCQGVISFISQKGRLSNYALDNTKRLVTYDFPQQRPAFLVPEANTSGTLFWNPDATAADAVPSVSLSAGRYQLCWQALDAKGQIIRRVQPFIVK